jgi:hypothetical protein
VVRFSMDSTMGVFKTNSRIASAKRNQIVSLCYNATFGCDSALLSLSLSFCSYG